MLTKLPANNKVSIDTRVPIVEYIVTTLEQSLLPVILTPGTWGENNGPVLEKAIQAQGEIRL